MNKEQIFAFLKNSKKNLIFLVLAILAILIFFNIFNGKKQESRDIASAENEVKTHNCSVGNFKQSINKGEKAEFEIFLDKSRFWPKYRVSLGNLPRGVSGIVKKSEGRGSGKARIELEASLEAVPGNYSLIIFYEEMKEDGGYERTECQYNLMIK